MLHPTPPALHPHPLPISIQFFIPLNKHQHDSTILTLFCIKATTGCQLRICVSHGFPQVRIARVEASTFTDDVTLITCLLARLQYRSNTCQILILIDNEQYIKCVSWTLPRAIEVRTMATANHILRNAQNNMLVQINILTKWHYKVHSTISIFSNTY